MRAPHPTAAFTLVELLVGMTLALTVMTAIMSSYLFLGRQLARLTHQQTLETEARRALQWFDNDVRMSSAITSPGDTSVVLTIPTASSTMTVTYTYASGANYTGTLTRTPSVGTAQVLLRYLGSFDFNYYNASDTAVTDFTNKVASIKKISLTFTSQTGRSTDGTLTPVYQGASPRLAIRNKPLLN